MHYLSLAEVLELHRQIIEQSGGARGICDLRSQTEQRYYCFGAVQGGILTVRFTYRRGIIRIFGAGYWRKGKQIYELENHLHQWTPGGPVG